MLGLRLSREFAEIDECPAGVACAPMRGHSERRRGPEADLRRYVDGHSGGLLSNGRKLRSQRAISQTISVMLSALFSASSPLHAGSVVASAALDQDSLRRVGIYVVSLILSVAVHEFCHAWAAHRLGDPTPESQGRLTLNPLSHIDLLGTIGLPIMAGLFGGPLFGWGKPVPTQPRRYSRNVSMRVGLALVAIAGPVGNLLLGAMVVGVAALLSAAGQLPVEISFVLQNFVALNLILMVFNLIPLHPLDGGKILRAVLPTRFEYIDDFSRRWGGYGLILLIVVGGPLLATLFSPFMRAVGWIWLHAVAVP